MYNVVKCDKNGMTGEMYLSTLRNGANFHKTNSVTEVTTSLSQLVNGTGMFGNHNKMTTFNQDLPNLKAGRKYVCINSPYFFQREFTKFTKWSRNVPKCEVGIIYFEIVSLHFNRADVS